MLPSNQQHSITIIDKTIQQRRTLKVFGDLEQPPILADDFTKLINKLGK